MSIRVAVVDDQALDRSRNRSGRWCTMSLCGNQAKVHAHRQRAKQ